MSVDFRNIEKETVKNKHYRKVLYTDQHMQLVLMHLKKGETIPAEVHRGSQFFRIEKGHGVAIIDNTKYLLTAGITLIVPAGQEHLIIADRDLWLYTIYSPKQHAVGHVDHRQPSLST